MSADVKGYSYEGPRENNGQDLKSGGGRNHIASLDIFWLKDESLADSDNLPPPEVIAQEIVEDLEAALEQFRLIAGDLATGTDNQAQ